jgi:hypothetical protein
VDTNHGAGYGNTLTWDLKDASHPKVQPVEIQFNVDTQKFYNMFLKLMTAPTPH